MWMLFKMAARNLLRNRRRSLINAVVIVISVASVVLALGFFKGMEDQMIDNLIRTKTGHIQIHSEGYVEREKEDEEIALELSIDDPSQLKELLKKDPSVEDVTSRIKFVGTVSNGIDSMPTLGIGIEPVSEPRVSSLVQVTQERGRYLASGDEASILIGKEMTILLNAELGDILTIATETAYGAVNAMDFEVVGIFRANLPEYERMMVFIPITQAQQLLDMGRGVSEIAMTIDDPDNDDKVKEGLQQSIGGSISGLEFHTWRDLEGDAIAIARAKLKGFMIILFFVFVIVASIIINTMLMAVLERTREVGMMLAMGIKRSQVVILFLFEGLILGLTSSLVGCAIGGLITEYFTTTGISMGMDMESWGMPLTGQYFYTSFKASMLFTALIFGIILVIIATLYPAYKASKLKPIDAIRHI